MTRFAVGGALALALVMVGCEASVAPPPAGELAAGGRYRLLALEGVAVTASSVENSWHPASNVLDGNLVSAWAPSYDDATPTLEFDLGGTRTFTDFAVKLSPAGTTVAVEVWNGAGWELVASGLTPAEAVLQTFDVPDRTTSRVRLTFGGVAASDLFVCEVALNGGAVPASPSPTPAVSPTPSTPPSTPPSATPTPGSCDCKVTGGGFVRLAGDGPNDKATFGLVALTNPGRGATGNITVVDHRTRTRYGGRVTAIACAGNTVTFSGTLRRGGAPFTATVTDNGEPGVDDTFSFTTGGFTASGDLGGGLPGGGNIQVHRPNCD